MKPSKTSSSANSHLAAPLSMTGKTVAEYEGSRISGPLSKQEFLAYLRKNGKLAS